MIIMIKVPATMFTRWLKSSPIRIAIKDVNSEGLKTTVFPQAKPGPNFQEIITRGYFQLVQQHR